MRLRVLVVEPQGKGGIWHYACSLSRALASAGVEVVLATLIPFERCTLSEGIPIRIFGSRRRFAPWPPGAMVRSVVKNAERLLGLARVVTEFRPQVVHFHSPLSKFDFVYTRVLRVMGVKVVYTAHDSLPLQKDISWFDMSRYRGADAVLVHSSNGVDDLATGGVDRHRIERIPHGSYAHLCDRTGVDQPAARRTLGLPESARVILFFGRISPYKGLDLLIEAFAGLAQADPGLYLVIAGEPRTDFSEYQQTIDRLALNGRILTDLRYIPFEEFAKFFLACDLVVLPYRRIYQSGILQLAYGFGRPVVVTDVGGIAESVREDRTGLVAAAGDAEALAGAIREALADLSRARAMGDQARYLTQTKYSWETIVPAVIEVYRSVCRRT